MGKKRQCGSICAGITMTSKMTHSKTHPISSFSFSLVKRCFYLTIAMLLTAVGCSDQSSKMDNGVTKKAVQEETKISNGEVEQASKERENNEDEEEYKRAAEDAIPQKVREILKNADHWDLYSISPKSIDRIPKGGFHEYKILGQMKVSGKNQTAMRLSLEETFESEFSVIFCFDPRHGIRASWKGDTVDLVLCFECITGHIHLEDREEPYLINVRKPLRDRINQILQKASIPLAPRRGGK
jgi:hypothetical protein